MLEIYLIFSWRASDLFEFVVDLVVVVVVVVVMLLVSSWYVWYCSIYAIAWAWLFFLFIFICSFVSRAHDTVCASVSELACMLRSFKADLYIFGLAMEGYYTLTPRYSPNCSTQSDWCVCSIHTQTYTRKTFVNINWKCQKKQVINGLFFSSFFIFFSSLFIFTLGFLVAVYITFNSTSTSPFCFAFFCCLFRLIFVVVVVVVISDSIYISTLFRFYRFQCWRNFQCLVCCIKFNAFENPTGRICCFS